MMCILVNEVEGGCPRCEDMSIRNNDIHDNGDEDGNTGHGILLTQGCDNPTIRLEVPKPRPRPSPHPRARQTNQQATCRCTRCASEELFARGDWRRQAAADEGGARRRADLSQLRSRGDRLHKNRKKEKLS